MRNTPLMVGCVLVCCSAALVLVAGCNPQRTDDTLTDEDRAMATAPATAPMPTAPPPGAVPMGQPLPQGPAMLGVATGAPGEHLVDSLGRAVYVLEGDTDGSKCSGACLEAWPPLRADGIGAAGTTAAGTTGPAGTTASAGSVRSELIGTIPRDGSEQVAYNGHPLYRYAKDTGPGSTGGHDVDDQWGEWYLIAPAGEAIDDH